METVLVENRANLPGNVFEPIRRLVQTQRTMDRVLAWLVAQVPPLAPEDLIAQDEFSYDLLIPYCNGLFLSYATS